MIVHDNVKCKRNFGDLHEKLTDKTTRKSIGMFYTPDFVIDYILKYTVEEIDVLANPYVNILDPSCGAGYFLIKAYEILKYKFEKNIEFLKKKYNDKNYWCRENIPYHIIKNCLYGVDIDPIAVKIATKKISTLCNKISNEDINILQCDSLIKWEEDNIPKEYIKGDYQKLKKFWSREFDYIIGNPPYGVLLKSKIDEKYWNYIINNYKTMGYKKNKFCLFMERALEKLKRQGFHGFIIPDRYFLSNSYIESRKNLLQNTKVISITQLSGKIFKEAIVGTAIYIVQKTGLKDEHKISLKLDYVNENKFDSVNIDQNYINIDKDKKYVINILTKKEYTNIIKKIESKSQELKTFCNVHVGMMIKDKDEHFRYSRFKDEKNKIVVGRDLGRYIVENEDRYCCLENINIFGGTKNIEKHFLSPKILLRKTGKHLIASIDKKGIISEQSIYMIIPFSLDKVYNILGQIQSKLCDFYFTKTLVTNPNAYPYIQHYDVKRLPINFDILYNNKYMEIIKDIIKTKENIKNLEFNGKENSKHMLQVKLDRCIKKNNLILYKYYGLEEKEIDLIENATVK